MKPVFYLLAGILITGSVSAVPSPVRQAVSMPDAAIAPQPANPAAALRAGMDRLLGFLGGENAPEPEALKAFLNNEIAPFFDFDHMAKTAGGRLFERMDGAQQQAITDSLRESFLAKMADKLSGYDRQQVRFLPPRAGNDGRTAQVSVAILNPGRYPSRLDFRMYRGGDRWRIYDVAANGQSAIVHYRRELMREAQRQRMQQMRQMMPAARPTMPPAYPRYPMR